MALQEVNTILQVLQHAMAAKTAREQFLQDREFRERQFKAEEEQRKIQNEANQKLYELRKAELGRAQIADEYSQIFNKMKYNIQPPGAEDIQLAQKPEPFKASPIMLQNAPMQGPPITGTDPRMIAQAAWGTQGTTETRAPQVNPTLTLSDLQESITRMPSGNIYRVPQLEQTPEQRLIKQQTIEAEATKYREAQFASNLQRQLHAQSVEDQIKILGMQEQFQDEQRRKSEAAASALQKARLDNAREVARMKASGGMLGFGGSITYDDENNPVFTPNDPAVVMQSVMDKVRNGEMTLEEFKTRYPVSKPAGQMLNAALQENNVTPISKKQVDDLKEIDKVSSIVDKLQRIHQLRKDHIFALQFPFSDATSEFNRLAEEIKGDLAGVSKWKNMVPRFTNVELGTVKESILPSTDWIRHSGAEEYKKYIDFVKDVQNSFNTTLSNVGEDQKAIIREKMGLNKYAFLKNTLTTPGTPVGNIGGATPPSYTVNPQDNKFKPPGNPKPGQIWVRKKASGEEGWLDPKDFNDTKYEKIKPYWVK